MKRQRSNENLDSYGEKNVLEERRFNRTLSSSSSHRSFYFKPEETRTGFSSSAARYGRDRSVDDEREGERFVRNRSDHDFEEFDRRKGFNRYRDSSVRSGGGDRIAIHRSESFSGSRREFPKGFRSQGDRFQPEVSVSSWRKFGSTSKDFDEGVRCKVGSGRLDERGRARASPRGLRDGKLPTSSKDSGGEKSKLMASPSPVKGFRDETSKSKFPTWSKDSGSEQSKSVEVKNSDKLHNGSSSKSCSEMEEGELEPEHEPEVEVEVEFGVEDKVDAEAGNGAEVGTDAETKLETKVEPNSVSVSDTERNKREFSQLDNHNMEVESRNQVEEMDADLGDESEVLNEKAIVQSEKSMLDGDTAGIDFVELLNNQNNSSDEKLSIKDEKEVLADSNIKEKDLLKNGGDCHVQSEGNNTGENVQFEVGVKQLEDINLEVKAENLEALEINKETAIQKEATEAEGSNNAWDCLVQNLKDKGKHIAVDSADCGVGRSSRNIEISLDSDMEGPNVRGFELFTRSPARRKETTDQCGDSLLENGNLTLEPLDLSLSLPSVLLPIGASGDSVPGPSSPGPARSIQSLSNTFCSNSDAFTASMSFSGSVSFFHNPSCSLTHNSMENYEQSVGSRPIFQGIDQASQGVLQGQSQTESEHKDVSLYQKILMNGGGSDPSREGSSKNSNGLVRQLSFNRQLSGQLNYTDDVRTPTQSVGSHDIRPTFSSGKKQIKKEKSSGSLYRASSLKEQEKLLTGGADFVDNVIARVISEPMHEMTKKFSEMTAQSITSLKEGIREVMSNPDRHRQVYSFQKTLQNRFDITLDLLLKSHRAQLEVLVALKTGLTNFLKHNSNVSTSDLAEIFLNLRCRNLTCRNLLPVNECDCKVCERKSGFCSACMCLVCSKFDMASNTCSWVGCDVCLHWCHTDCGLRKSCIRNGSSSSGTSEMQFRCVACDHPSEMFGFVKEVFQHFAKGWTAETFSRELEYVKRIFSGSKDIKGRQLHELADQLLVRLPKKSNFSEVYGQIMTLFSDGDSSKFDQTLISSTGEGAIGSSGTSGPSQDMRWLKSAHSEKAPQLDRAINRHPSFNYDRDDKRVMASVSELKKGSPREPIFDELDSIVRVKLAKAEMFQVRADDARREAERLKRIALAKKAKIDEEYSNRMAKLRLGEAEGKYKQRMEDLKSLERRHREYSGMKMRMEEDIKNLLSKMEATKRAFAV